jgi:hypothetical protein
MRSNPSGVRIRAYPTGIPDAALERLRVLADTKVVPRAPRFGAWLLDLIDDETSRRLRSRPQEPSMPVLPPSWSNAELGEALVVGRAIEGATKDGNSRAFLARVNACIAALAAHRLERSDST